MNIEKLRVGMVVKNYNLMCEVLGVEVITSGGNSKKAQLKEWERYFKYHKQGNKFIIDEIYNTPLEKIDERQNTKGNNNIYGKYIEKLVLDLLVQKYQNTKERKIYLSRDKMLRSLSMVNDNYSFGKFNREILSNYINTDSSNVKEFYILNNRNLYETVERAFNSLSNKCLVSWKTVITVAIDISEEDKIIIDEDCQAIKIKEHHRPATEEEEDIILNAEREVLESMELDGKKEAFLQDRYKEFNEKVCKLLKETTYILYYYKSYDVIFHEKVVQELEKINQWILEQEERQDIKVTLNGIVSNNLITNAENRQSKAIKEMEKHFGAYNNKYREAKLERRSEDTYITDNKEIINTVINCKVHDLTQTMIQNNKDDKKKTSEGLKLIMGF